MAEACHFAWGIDGARALARLCQALMRCDGPVGVIAAVPTLVDGAYRAAALERSASPR